MSMGSLKQPDSRIENTIDLVGPQSRTGPAKVSVQCFFGPKESPNRPSEVASNGCIASSNRCLTSRNKKLVVTSALLVVTIRI